MKVVHAELESFSPYSQSRFHQTPKLDKEKDMAWEERTWRERLHVSADGFVYLPAPQFKNCLGEAASYLGEKIQGKGNRTYTKIFDAGILIVDPIVLPIKKADVVGEMLMMAPDGKRGPGKRVPRIYPRIDNWAGTLTIHVLDETIDPPVLERTLKAAGQFIGIGRWRPIVRGSYGRFRVNSITWE